MSKQPKRVKKSNEKRSSKKLKLPIFKGTPFVIKTKEQQDKKQLKANKKAFTNLIRLAHRIPMAKQTQYTLLNNLKWKVHCKVCNITIYYRADYEPESLQPLPDVCIKCSVELKEHMKKCKKVKRRRKRKVIAK